LDGVGGDDEVVVGGVDGDSEGPRGCWGGKQSKTTKSPPCRPVSLARLVEVGGLLAFCHTKSAGVGPHPGRDPLHTPNWREPVRRIYKKERQKPLN
jgi:hypothetical protein